MRNKRWVDILITQRQLDPDCTIIPVEGKDDFYLVEGIDTKTSVDESLLVYDCTVVDPDEGEFLYEEMLALIEQNYDPYPVLVFKDWEHERQLYWNYYNTLSKASDKKQFADWYKKKLSIYVNRNAEISLLVGDDGINYLEYPGSDSVAVTALHSKVYNVSFHELKKLFNVTGTYLFASNVRYGLQRGSTSESLKSSFREYISGAVYKKAIELHFSDEQLDALKDALDVDAALIPYVEEMVKDGSLFEMRSGSEIAPSLKEGLLLPENFWFYHNGVSIFVNEPDLATPSNQIILHPDNVSVINGAQTLTNFFLEAEAVELILKRVIGAHIPPANEVINSVIKKIYVKTIFIYGDSTYIRSITHGLNTQIPVLEESLLADSSVCDDINKILKKNSGASAPLKILKDGEVWTGFGGLDVISFVKHWLVIHAEPGRSKNYSKDSLAKDFKSIRDSLQENTEDIKKMSCLLEVYRWWENSPIRRSTASNDERDIAIGKYGKNYFGSYVLFISDDVAQLDDTVIEVLYSRFIMDLKTAESSSGIPITQEAFKRDDLSKELFVCSKHTDDDRTKHELHSEGIEQELKNMLNQAKPNAYAFSRAITEYLLARQVDINYFRVISRTHGKCREAFPFPNSTFNEIADRSMLDETADHPRETYLPFEKSAFAAAVKKPFPVFVIDKDDQDGEHLVSDVHLIKEFSFDRFLRDAQDVYEQTISAFQRGEEARFPRSSEDRKFHVRPKAVNAEDTFQFTNGNYITKRSFWANKKTVDTLIAEALGEKGD